MPRVHGCVLGFVGQKGEATGYPERGFLGGGGCLLLSLDAFFMCKHTHRNLAGMLRTESCEKLGSSQLCQDEEVRIPAHSATARVQKQVTGQSKNTS